MEKKNIRLFDGHCDTASVIHRRGAGLYKSPGHVDLSRGLEYSGYAQFFAIFAAGGDVEAKYRAQLNNLLNEFEKNKHILAHCRRAEDGEDALTAGKTAAFISVEGAELLGCSEERLEEAFTLGIRAVNITWNFENALSGSNAEGADKGLTAAGRSFVKKCQSLGVLTDVSHISDPAFWGVMEISQKPVIASHSNSRRIWSHRRNLTDSQFLAIKETGGTAGINLYSEFLGENPGIDTIIGHIEHFLALGGEKSVSIGADFDGCDKLPSGISGIEDMHKLYEALLRMNYPESLVEDIFFNNLMSAVKGGISV